jgi:hypothetical protein
MRAAPLSGTSVTAGAERTYFKTFLKKRRCNLKPYFFSTEVSSLSFWITTQRKMALIQVYVAPSPQLTYSQTSLKKKRCTRSHTIFLLKCFYYLFGLGDQEKMALSLASWHLGDSSRLSKSSSSLNHMKVNVVDMVLARTVDMMAPFLHSLRPPWLSSSTAAPATEACPPPDTCYL